MTSPRHWPLYGLRWQTVQALPVAGYAAKQALTAGGLGITVSWGSGATDVTRLVAPSCTPWRMPMALKLPSLQAPSTPVCLQRLLTGCLLSSSLDPVIQGFGASPGQPPYDPPGQGCWPCWGFAVNGQLGVLFNVEAKSCRHRTASTSPAEGNPRYKVAEWRERA